MDTLLQVGLLSLLIQTTVCHVGHGTYMLVFPDTIRPGMQFGCMFSRADKTPKLTMTASITYGATPVVSKTFDIVGMNHSFSLQIPATLESGSYSLEVQAEDRFGLSEIKGELSLDYYPKKSSVFIQTDKAIYRPGQSVQFRVFAVNSTLGVLHETMDIDIFDPSKNRISQWRDVKAPSGVFQGKMVMSSQPPLGDWSIQVIYEGADKVTKRFTVEEFVLPKFEVSLSTQGLGVMTDPYLSGTVSAKYTFGKNVQGNGTLIVTRKYYSYKYSLSFQIEGSYKFQINRQELFTTLHLTYPSTLQLDVTVTETLTGNTMSDTEELRYYSRLEKIQLDGAAYFKPGLRYTTYVMLTDQKDRPLSAGNQVVDINVKLVILDKPDLDDRQINRTVQIGANGIGKLSIKVPRSVQQLDIKAMYGDDLSTLRYVEPFQSPSKSFIQVTVLSKSIKSGKDARFLIRATGPKKWIHYVMVSKEGISNSGAVYMESRKMTVDVPIAYSMAPTARMMVYYIRKNNEVVAGSVKFTIEGIFDNKVNIRFRKTTIKPGKDVSLVVRADPGSQCNILAVDKSILLLKKGNDISADMVENELYTYDRSYLPSCTLCAEKLFPTPLPAQDVISEFTMGKLSVITNAMLYKYERPWTSTTPWYYYDDYYYYYSYSMAAMSTSRRTSTLRVTASSMFATTQEPEPEPETPPPKSRSLFPDTWIYSNNAIANSKGKCYLKATVPDTITSWVATAFAVHNSSGLGVASGSANLGVFLKFFVRLELPYSVTRGEQLILKASVFNFFPTDIKVSVMLRNTGCFENIIVSQSQNGSSILSFSKEDIYRQITVTGHILQIGADNAVTLKFPIKPTELGECEIDIQTLSPTASDAVKRQLLVKAEGIEENYNIPILIDVDEENKFSMEQPITIPENVVSGSVKIRLAVVGDIMGPTLSGIDNLLRMPYGCGEQNMVSFVPNIFAIQYLEAVNNLKPEVLEKAKEYMVAGYQRELIYQHDDASFSAYGYSDPSGSTWLTAFVVKSYAQASPYIYIDPAIMARSVTWILGQFDDQTRLFKEPGRVWSSWMKGGSSNAGPRTLAAFTLIALLETRQAGFYSSSDQASFANVISNAAEHLEESIDEMNNTYELAISSYALALSGSNGVNKALAKLETMSINEGGSTHWEVLEGRSSPRSRNTETTAYVLLTYIVQNDIAKGISVMRWLVKQRNSNGGFTSTQDTVIGLQALADIAPLIFSPDVDLKIDTTAQPSASQHAFVVNANNVQLFQTLYIPQTTVSVKIEATGNGMTLVQISVTYNVMEDPEEPMFDLVVSSTGETMDGFKLKACFNWLGDGVSGMAVMEIGLLSGFSADRFTVTSLGILKKTEDGDNMVVLYFDEIPSEMECIELELERTDLVAGSQPAVVKLYDYYDPSNHVIGLYQPGLLKDTNVCDIDSGEDIGCAG